MCACVRVRVCVCACVQSQKPQCEEKGWTLLAMCLATCEPASPQLVDIVESWLLRSHRDEALDARLKMHQTRIAGALRAVPPAAVISGDLPRSPAEIFWQGERERIQLDAVMWQGEEKVDQKVVKWKT